MPVGTEAPWPDGSNRPGKPEELKQLPLPGTPNNAQEVARIIVADNVFTSEAGKLSNMLEDLLGTGGEGVAEKLMADYLPSLNSVRLPDGRELPMPTENINPISLRQQMIIALDWYLFAPEIIRAHFLEVSPAQPKV